MNKKYKHSINRSVYMPEELVSCIQDEAVNKNSSFNKIIVDLLLDEFLKTKKIK